MFIDVLIVAIILGSVVLGYKIGFVKSIFRFCSGLLSMLFSISFYGPFSEFMLKTSLFSSVKDKIASNVLRMLADTPITSKIDINNLILDKMFIPNPIKESILKDVGTSVKLVDSSSVAELIGNKLGTIVISLISVILVFVLVRFLLFVLKILLDKIFCLPVLKQVNGAAGLVLGAVEGIFLVYIILSIVFIMNNQTIISAIDKSILANYFYYNNIIIDIMF